MFWIDVPLINFSIILQSIISETEVLDIMTLHLLHGTVGLNSIKSRSWQGLRLEPHQKDN